MEFLSLKLQRVKQYEEAQSASVAVTRAEIQKMIVLLRMAMGGGVAAELASLLKKLADNGPAIQKGLIAWVHLVEVLVQEAERGMRNGRGPRKKSQVKAALFRILTNPKAQLPGIPRYLYPLVMDVAIEWVIDGIVQAENEYGLWNSRPAENEWSPVADCFSWLKNFVAGIWERAAGLLIRAYTNFKYREPLNPELQQAVDGVLVNGLLNDKNASIRSAMELVRFLGDHSQQAIAAIKLVFEAVHHVESFLELDGPAKKKKATVLILATLEELGFPVGSGFTGVVKGAMIEMGIEAAWSIFSLRAPETFKHRGQLGSAAGAGGAP